MVRSRHNPDLIGLGHFIRRRRADLGLTQHEFASRIGYVQERVSLLENGKYGMPSLPALADLADALEVQLPELLGAAGYRAAPRLVAPVQPGSRSHATHLMHESSRLAVGLEDLQTRLADVERQLQTVDVLRQQMVQRRKVVQGLTETIRQITG